MKPFVAKSGLLLPFIFTGRALIAALLLAGLARAAALPVAAWKEVDGTRIPVPPAGHPRLFLNPAEVVRLPARLREPDRKAAVERLRNLAARDPEWKLEWAALSCLVDGDRQAGRAIIQRTIAALRAVRLDGKHDGGRDTGRWMVTGAIVYDWLHPLLTDAEKQDLIAELKRLAGTLECGYPPVKQSSVVSHTSEAMFMRDLLSAGIAIYDEFPEMYELAARRFFAEHLPVRKWFYQGGAHHQGDSYGPYRFGWDLFPLFIFDRMGFPNIYGDQQRWVPYYYLYLTRPDGQRLRSGDTFGAAPPRGQPWNEGFTPLFAASYYRDGHLMAHALQHTGVRAPEALFEVLWSEPGLEPRSVAELPLSRYFGGPFGWMIARTGWDRNAAMADLRINEYNFCNHQHLDAGAFQLFYRGALAIDSGLYRGSSGDYNSPHCRNYAWRTIAHNSLLIHDPDEKFGGESGAYRNDGGQRLPNERREPRTLDDLLTKGYRTGRVLAAAFGPDRSHPAYTLLSGDITAAYGPKARQVERTFVFLNLGLPHLPAALVVHDRITASNPAFGKFWLLHSQEEPAIQGAAATIDCTKAGEGGRLRLDVLLPEAGNLRLEKIGGPGKEFWVFGENQTNEADLRNSSLEPGAWRVEVSPRTPAASDEFLAVMQLTDREAPRALAVGRLAGDAAPGCVLQGPDGFWQVRFVSGEIGQPVEIAATGAGSGRYLLVGLPPGNWTVQAADGRPVARARVEADAGCLWFEAPAGRYSCRLDPPS